MFSYLGSDILLAFLMHFFLVEFRISRDINPSLIQNSKNLTQEVFLLGAFGSLNGKCFVFVNSFIVAVEDWSQY